MNGEQIWDVQVETLRGGFVESRSRVSVVAVTPTGKVLMRGGNAALPVFWRSAAKFVQALGLVQSGAAAKFGFGAQELALACASHSGGPEHVAVAARMLDLLGLTAADLRCGVHVPLGEPEARALAATGQSPTALHNNCSGKHAGMLATCLIKGWPLHDYNRLHHPLQQQILADLCRVSDIPREQVQTAVDGCGAVVFRTALHGLALAYARLAADALPAPLQEAGQVLRQAITAAPSLIAGAGRLCTDLMEQSHGRLIAKIGADGVYGLGLRSGPLGPCGLALKIEDGNGKLLGPLVCELLSRLQWLTSAELTALHHHHHLPLLNHQQEQVGEVVVRVVPRA